MADQIHPDVQKLARNLGEKIKQSQGLDLDPLLNPANITQKRMAAAGLSDDAPAATNDSRPESRPVVSGGENFFTQPTPGDIAKRKAGPHMDADGHPMTDKAWAAQEAANKSHRQR